MPNCVVCTKAIPAGSGIKKKGKDFCCANCLFQFDDKNRPDTKDKECEFC